MAKEGVEGEAELAARAGGGDSAAFDELARRLWGRIGRYAAAAAAGDPELASRIAQESLVRLHAALPRFRGEASLGTFVYRVCAIAAADAFRRLARERRRLGPLPEEEELPSPEPGPEEAALRGEAAAALRRALGRLDEGERALVYLKEAEGLGVAELAESFGIPEGTVKSRLFRARAKLKAALEEEGYGID